MIEIVTPVLMMMAGLGAGALVTLVARALPERGRLLGRLIYRGGEPLGAGDITIAALLGAMAGFPGVFTALLVGIFAGGIAAIAILATGGSEK